MNIQVRLDLSKHCIETAIKKTYNQALSTYFKAEGKKKHLEQEIALTQHALECFDFAKLRGKYKDLEGHTQQEVFLCRCNEKCTIVLDNKVIDPIIKA